MEHTKLLTPKQAAEQLHLHVMTIYQMLNSGALQGIKTGPGLRAHWRISPAAVRQWEKENAA